MKSRIQKRPIRNVLMVGCAIGLVLTLLAGCGTPATPPDGEGDDGARATAPESAGSGDSKAAPASTPGSDSGGSPPEQTGSGSGASGSGSSGSSASASVEPSSLPEEFSPRMIAFTTNIMLIATQEELDKIKKVMEPWDKLMREFTGGNRFLPLFGLDANRIRTEIYRTEGPPSIYVMDTNGRGLRRLTNAGADSPTWSPDFKKIAFVFDGEVWVMNADATGKKRLTQKGGWSPTWSPDGKQIAFGSSRADQSGYIPDIFVMDADGTGQRRLTRTVRRMPDYQRSEFAQRFGAEGAYDPAWSPNGAKIAFTSVRDNNNSEIYVMNADGTGIVLLTDHLADPDGENYDDDEPAWSPDGTKIAFSSNRDGEGEIYVVTLDDGVRTRLTDNTEPASNPAWAPDGTKIAFTSGTEFNGNTILMNPDGSGQQTLVSTVRGKDLEPSFGPMAAMRAPEGHEQTRAGRYKANMLSNSEHLRKALNDEIRLGNLCSQADFCPSADRVKAAKAIKDAYEALRNVEPPDCAVDLHVRSVDVLQYFYVSAEQAISMAGFGIPLLAGGETVADKPEWRTFREGLASFDQSACDGPEEDPNRPSMFLQAISSEHFRQADPAFATVSPGQPRRERGEAPAPKPTYPPRKVGDLSQFPEPIVFMSARNGAWGAYVMNSDGSNVTKYIDTNGRWIDHAWSPDGKKLAFAAWSKKDVNMWMMNTDGTGLTSLVSEFGIDTSPAWSPDSSRIAFSSDRDGRDEIFVIDADGSNLKKLTHDGGASPDWSPDGTEIAYVAVTDRFTDVFVMNVDGTNVRRLTDQRGNAKTPVWSPDGTKIAYTNGHIYIMNADGSDLKNATEYTSGSRFAHPSWSPDGTRMIVERIQNVVPEIVELRADGTHPIVRVKARPGKREDRHPVWLRAR